MKKTGIKLAMALFVGLFGEVSNASVIESCGLYQIDGNFRSVENPLSHEKQPAIVVAGGTESQMIVFLSSTKNQEELKRLKEKLTYEFKVKITTQCDYLCRGELESFKKYPRMTARSFFYPRPKPIGPSLGCDQNPYEKRRLDLKNQQ